MFIEDRVDNFILRELSTQADGVIRNALRGAFIT
jgi:hypothetical protein